jgi:hypothetical protein
MWDPEQASPLTICSGGDGYGNVCDPDLNNDAIVIFSDVGLLKAVFFSADPDADFNDDGAVNFVDVGTMKAFFLPASRSERAGGSDERRKNWSTGGAHRATVTPIELKGRVLHWCCTADENPCA